MRPHNPEQRESGHLTVRAAGESIVGERGVNEDAVLIDQQNQIFGIFDGMGGHIGGDWAAAIAKQEIAKRLSVTPDNMSSLELREVMRQSLQEASERISAEKRDMGTTASVVLVRRTSDGRNVAVIGSVGDSRVYRFSAKEGLRQLTLDDDLIKKQIKDILKVLELQNKLSNTSDPVDLSDEERWYFNKRNIITQALGSKNLNPQVHDIEALPGEVLLISSDGIHDNLTSIEIEQVLRQTPDIQDVSRLLIAGSKKVGDDEKPRAKGYLDDMSVIVVKFD